MFKLYRVQHKLGNFFGVARNMKEARAHWGDLAEITEYKKYEDASRAVLNQRVNDHDRVFLAI
jgi:hypothetical protein